MMKLGVRGDMGVAQGHGVRGKTRLCRPPLATMQGMQRPGSVVPPQALTSLLQSGRKTSQKEHSIVSQHTCDLPLSKPWFHCWAVLQGPTRL